MNAQRFLGVALSACAALVLISALYFSTTAEAVCPTGQAFCCPQPPFNSMGLYSNQSGNLYEECNDILNGERNFLEFDDLAISATIAAQGNAIDTKVWFFEAENNAISQQFNDLVSKNATTLAKTDKIVIGHFTGDIFPSLRTAGLAAVVTSNSDANNIGDSLCAGVGPDELILSLWRVVPGTGGNIGLLDCGSLDTTLPFGTGDLTGVVWSMTKGDFNHDGIEDIFVNYLGDGGYRIISFSDATDPGDIFGGVTYGPEGTGLVLRDVAVGDFNGDGKQDIVGVGISGTDKLELYLLEVDPVTLAITPTMIDISALDFTLSVRTVAVAAGEFDTINPFVDEIIVIGGIDYPGQVSGELILAEIKAFELDPSTNTPINVATQTINSSDVDLGGGADIIVMADSKKFITGEQLTAIGMSAQFVNCQDGCLSFVQLSIVDFDNNAPNPLSFSLINHTFAADTISLGGLRFCMSDIAVGNFNYNTDIPVPVPLVAAVFYEASSGCRFDNLKTNGTTLRIFDDTAQLSEVIVADLGDGIIGAPQLAAGDLESHSFLLGDPNKIVINNHKQVDLVQGVPPMHMTSLPGPQGASNTPGEITAFPLNFFSTFGEEVTSGQSVSSTSTTSYSFSTRQEFSEKITYGFADVDSVSAAFTQTAEQSHDGSVSRKFDRYVEESESFESSTSTDDILFFTQKNLNIWTYPVLGADGQVCAACVAGSSCPTTDVCTIPTAPMHIQYTAPDNIQFNRVPAASTMEWYQPVVEPLNVLTYPWTLAHLENEFPGFLPIDANEIQVNSTGPSGASEVSVKWQSTTTSGITTGSGETHSFNTSEAVSGSVEFDGVGGDADASFDYNKSRSISNNLTTEKTTTASQGFTITREDAFPAATDTQYPYASLLFGQTPPEFTLDKRTLASVVDLQTEGPLFLGFMANPNAMTSGGWWTSTYTSPDVGLNHPFRWTFNTPPDDNITQLGEFTFNPKDQFPTVPVKTLFYHMRGFFVVPETLPDTPCDDHEAIGPQRTRAVEGDTLLLCARVYNLSLTDMPAGSEVMVRFYRQEWDGSNLTGDSVLIGGTQTLPVIPPSGNNPDNCTEPFTDPSCTNPPNWEFARTTLDTTGLGDTYWYFWVVVWMENGGSLVSELPGLGLNRIPPAMITSFTDVDVQDFSNNVGLYKQVFYVQPPPPAALSLTSSSSGEELTRINGASVEVESVTASPFKIVPGERSGIDAIIKTIGTAADDVTVSFFDGDPDNGGELFDQEEIPHIRTDSSFVAFASFSPQECGFHNIFVEARSKVAPPAVNMTQMVLECPRVIITEAVYTESIQELLVKGIVEGLEIGGKVELFDLETGELLGEIPEENLGIKDGKKRFSFLLNNIGENEAPCAVLVVAGRAKDLGLVDGNEACGAVPVPPTPTSTPTPTPMPSPPPSGENVAVVGDVTIISPEGTVISGAEQVTPECPDMIDGLIAEYPLGFFTYKVSNVTPGGTIQVEYMLPPGAGPFSRFFKFGPTPDNPVPHCYEFTFDGTTGTQFLPNGNILLTIMDGGRGDSDLTADGMVTDPGGPGVLIAVDGDPDSGGGCGLAGISVTESSLPNILIPIALGLLVGVRVAVRRRRDSA
ncbi:MAG: VCBS repeat-containing protein [Deltaproteobacteria bacterium]